MKALSSKRREAVVSDLRKAGVSKARSERVARKLILLSRPESVGRFVGKKKGARVYSLGGSINGGRIYIYKGAGGAGSRGKALVVFRVGKPARRRSKTRE